MELALSLGNSDKIRETSDFGFCMGLGGGLDRILKERSETEKRDDEDVKRVSSDLPVQLDLLPFSPVLKTRHTMNFRLHSLTHNLTIEPDSSKKSEKKLKVIRAQAEEVDDGAAQSSPTSGVSTFQMDFGLKNTSENKRNLKVETSRASDDEENGLTRKKLRLSKDQSAFLEDNFKEHSTLNPKQKIALAKQLNLRPRQIEVWFQNRRARTKLKQTEVDCEYLKRCCEKLTEENRRLQKELKELKALKTSGPLYMQLPATTLTMCPNCERVATTVSSAAAATIGADSDKSRLFPFIRAKPHMHKTQAH